jgi:hypothetical protein
MFTIYLICFLVGVGFSALSLFSMVGHSLTSGAAGHGHAHVPHVHGHAHGHAHAHAQATAKSGNVVHATQQAVDVAQEVSTPWLLRLNIAALVLFLAVFGGVGALMTRSSALPQILIAAIAAAGGIGGSMVVNRLMSALVSRERPLEPISYYGTPARVTIPIRGGGGTGEIIYTVDGTRRCSGARSNDGNGISKDAEVIILRYDKGIAYVAAFDDGAQSVVPSSTTV